MSDSEIGARPYTIYPTIHVDDLDIPCESVVLIWIWSDGTNSTQICDVSAPCSGCVFNGTGLDASYSHTYNYPGIYQVKLFVFDARAQVPTNIGDAFVSPDQIEMGPGWLAMTYGSIAVYDPTSGRISGSMTYFSDEAMYVE